MENQIPKCPYCNTLLYWNDEHNYEFEDTDSVFFQVEARCEICHRRFRWTEKYEYKNFYDFREEN